MQKKIVVCEDQEVSIGFLDCETKLNKDFYVYFSGLKKAEMYVEYNIDSGGNSFYLKLNGHKILNDIYCGWGGCKGAKTIDITNYIMSGRNDLVIDLYKAPFCHPGDKKMTITTYVYLEYESGGEVKEKTVTLFDNYEIKLGHMDSEKSVSVPVILETAGSKIIDAKLSVAWSVDVDQMACNFYWNGMLVKNFYCGWGQCSDSGEEDIYSFLRNTNKLVVRAYKPIWHPWATTTTVSAQLKIYYVGNPPSVIHTPPISGLLDYVKYGLVGAGIGGIAYLLTRRGGKK